MIQRVLPILMALALPLSAQGQATLPFPMRTIDGGFDTATGLPALVNVPGAVRDLLGHQAVVLRDFAMPGGETVDLELTRIDVTRRGFGFQVDGLAAPGMLDDSDLTVWKGTVAGRAGSDVVLSFSRYGTRGWVDTGSELVHVMAEPGAGKNWLTGRSLIALDGDLPAFGLEFRTACGTTNLGIDRANLDARRRDPVSRDSTYFYAGGCSFHECKIAVETDTQYTNVFGGDLGAASTYMTTLLTAISDRYEEQINTVLTFPYLQFYTGSDPWSTPDSGGSTSQMLDEFRTAWSGNLPAGAVLGHFISGASLGGGIAYLGALCDTTQQFTFAVSANLHGQTPVPITVSPLNWDFMVVAHETGHNFDSPHTHDLGIDNCAGGSCITNGTIMSYCHQCPGGLSNITTYFNVPVVVPIMTSHASNCLPFFSALAPLAQPSLIASGAPTIVQTDVQGTPVGTVDLSYRFDGGAFTTVAMTPVGGGIYEGTVPGPACGDAPEWYFSMTDAACGFTQSTTFSADVGTESIVAAFDFETSAGFTVGSPQDDATTGLWVRGDPIGTGAQPEDDHTPLGTDCWFTGQGSPSGSIGDADVDGGQTTLTSSVIDLSGGDARIGYWRWYDNISGNNPGADIFEVEVSNGGPWTNVETVGPTGAAGGWIYSEFTVSNFVPPNANVQVRFRASDEGGGSLVEAAIDDFRVFRVECNVTCQPDLGFASDPTARITACGGDLSAGNDATLELTGGAPLAPTLLVISLSSNPTPVFELNNATLVPLPIQAALFLPTDATGGHSIPIPGGSGPVTVYVQEILVNTLTVTNALQLNLLP